MLQVQTIDAAHKSMHTLVEQTTADAATAAAARELAMLVDPAHAQAQARRPSSSSPTSGESSRGGSRAHRCALCIGFGGC